MDIQDPKKKLMVNLGVSALVLGGLFLGLHFITGMSRVETDDAYVEGRIHNIAPKIPGTIKKVYIVDNQNVKKGDCLVEIDPIDYELRLNEAKAAMEVQKAASLQAERDKVRAEALFNDKVFSKEKFEKAVTAYELAKAQCDASISQWKIAERNLEYTKIIAPSDGYVTNKSVEEGNQVQPGQPLMAVVALHDTWIVANYKETQLKNVRPGQTVEIKVDTYPGHIFKGKVDSIMAGTGAAFSLFPQENALGNFVKVVQRIPVKIVLDEDKDDKHVLRIGMSCVPVIITKNG